MKPHAIEDLHRQMGCEYRSEIGRATTGLFRHQRATCVGRRLESQDLAIVDLHERQGQDDQARRYPELSLKDARQKARDYSDDPRKFAAQSLPDSFKDVAAHWFKQHVERNGLRSKGEIERVLNKYIYSKIGDQKFLDIRRGEINLLLDHVSDQHGPSQADSVLWVISSICSWYTVRNEHYESPIVRGMKRVKKDESKKPRFLNDDEISLVWDACDQLGTFGRLVKVALLLVNVAGSSGRMTRR